MEKNHYELLFIIPAKYTETELIPVKEMVAGIVKKFKGTITREDSMGKRKLAYAIKNAVHGYYCLFEFDAPTDKVQGLNDELRHTPEILRHIIVKIDENRNIELKKEMEKAEASKAEHEAKKNAPEKKEAPQKSEEKKEAKPISIEDLNKSLDEILKDDVI